ncbi:MAG: molecular chaperone HtpG [Bacteriovoracales bacterium]|nr:molecular chaperone HtpG [Bacteriovoracales bacterium]
MEKKTGQISVQTQNIFPIIKKWLYSEHDIFLRELVSNACDAITKRQALSLGKNVEVPEGKTVVIIDEKKKTICIEDNGIGMTEEEVERYITNLAFSGAEEFVEKMKEAGAQTHQDDIIGKFGLGLYSAFMVADKVEVHTLSMNENAQAVKWVCEGETEYSLEGGSRTDVGTSITLWINEESAEFLQSFKTREVLGRYCDFMPYPIVIRDLAAEEREAQTEEKNKKDALEKGNEYIPPAKTDDIINQTKPLWKKDPTSIKDDEYKSFFAELFPMEPPPLFWIHLNVDHPFTLQGILYFPKLNPHRPVQENSIKLYCKQVFVSDNMKNVIPDFLGLLKGVIDSTDIPLNVSRSSLQGDPNVKKISNYIVKKVADALKKLCRDDRKRYEEIWPDISLFVKYGSLGDSKFDEVIRPSVLFKNNEGTFFTMEEYKKSIPEPLREKVGDKILTYQAESGHEALISQLQEEGISCLEIDNIIDPHFTQHVEMHPKGDLKPKFCPIDTEVENLLQGEKNEEMEKKIKSLLLEVFDIKEDKKEDGESKEKDKDRDTVVSSDSDTLGVEVKSLKTVHAPAYFKIDHQMKRFQEMTKAMGQTPFNRPLKKTLVVNPNNPLVQNALRLWEGEKKDLAKKICHHIQDLAHLSGEGFEEGQKDAFVRRSQDLVKELSNLAL